jgi:hypothetical protein
MSVPFLVFLKRWLFGIPSVALPRAEKLLTGSNIFSRRKKDSSLKRYGKFKEARANRMPLIVSFFTGKTKQ